MTSKRQVTFPAAVLKALGAAPGSYLELQRQGDGYLIKAWIIDRSKLAPLRRKIGKESVVFDLEKFREERQDPALRD